MAGAGRGRMKGMRRAAFLLLALLLLGADVYRWVDSEGRVHYSDVPPKGVMPRVEPAPPAADSAAGATAPTPFSFTVLNNYLLQNVRDPAKPSFRLAVAVEVTGMEDAQVETEFDNPADEARPLRGERMVKPGSFREQFMMVSPDFDAIQCRTYAATVRVYRGDDRDQPVAVRREAIVSRIDSAALASGGAEATQRIERGERVCPE